MKFVLNTLRRCCGYVVILRLIDSTPVMGGDSGTLITLRLIR